MNLFDFANFAKKFLNKIFLNGPYEMSKVYGLMRWYIYERLLGSLVLQSLAHLKKIKWLIVIKYRFVSAHRDF